LITAASGRSLHARQRQPHHSHGLDQVPVQRPAPIGIAAVGNARTAATTPDIVDEDVDAAIGGVGCLDQPRGVLGNSDVGGLSRDLGADRAQGPFRLAQSLGRACRQHDPATLGGKRLSSRQSDAAARTGNQGDLAAQLEIHDTALHERLPLARFTGS
jgi:hypothetical protein